MVRPLKKTFFLFVSSLTTYVYLVANTAKLWEPGRQWSLVRHKTVADHAGHRSRSIGKISKLLFSSVEFETTLKVVKLLCSPVEFKAVENAIIIKIKECLRLFCLWHGKRKKKFFFLINIFYMLKTKAKTKTI